MCLFSVILVGNWSSCSSNKVPSAKNRQEDEVEMHFPLDTDIGTPVSDIPIMIVYNGFNHYAATKPLKTTFKDGVKELIALFCSARVLCDKHGQTWTKCC